MQVIDFLLFVITHKRMKSFYWRALDLAVVEIAFVVPEVMADFHVPQWIVLGIGLALGEVTKALNKKVTQPE